jgi:hypothetical protein
VQDGCTVMARAALWQQAAVKNQSSFQGGVPEQRDSSTATTSAAPCKKEQPVRTTVEQLLPCQAGQPMHKVVPGCACEAVGLGGQFCCSGGMPGLSLLTQVRWDDAPSTQWKSSSDSWAQREGDKSEGNRESYKKPARIEHSYLLTFWQYKYGPFQPPHTAHIRDPSSDTQLGHEL